MKFWKWWGALEIESGWVCDQQLSKLGFLRAESVLALLYHLRWLTGANRDRTISFVRRLLIRYPGLLPTGEGIQFIAYCHEWLPQATFDEILERLEASNWIGAQQAIGELLLLRAALVSSDGKCQARVEALRNSFGGVIDDIHLGLLHSASATWNNPRIREISHRVLISAIPHAKGDVAQAIMAVFATRDQERLAHDEFTSELLAAVATNPELLRITNTNLLIDRLKELLEDGYSPTEAGRLARRIVEIAEGHIADVSTSLAASAGDLFDIAMTLQRFPEARRDGTWIFERLLIANAYPMTKAIPALDRRF